MGVVLCLGGEGGPFLGGGTLSRGMVLYLRGGTLSRRVVLCLGACYFV